MFIVFCSTPNQTINSIGKQCDHVLIPSNIHSNLKKSPQVLNDRRCSATWRCAWIFLLSLFATLCTAMFRQILQIRSLCYPGLHTTFLLSIYLFLMQVATVCNFLYPCTLRVEFFYHLFVLFSSNYVCQLRYHSVFFMKLILFVVPQLKNKATGDTAIRICFLPCHLCLEHLFHTACIFTSLALSLVEHDFHPNHVGFV